MSRINCLITGVGGQGNVLTSKILAEAAMRKQYKIRTTETIGMAQRGGSVVGHVRIGDGNDSPLIGKKGADLIIGFDLVETVRVLPYLKQEGIIVVNSKGAYNEEMLTFLKRHVSKLYVIEGEKICDKCQHDRGLNMALLGAAIGTGILPFTLEEVQSVMSEKLKKQFLENNLQALSMGYREVCDAANTI